jgi:hypothetical protein
MCAYSLPRAAPDFGTQKIAAIFMTNCHAKNGRSLVLRELLSLLPGQIDSFGSCQHNADAREELQKVDAYDGIEDKSRWNLKLANIEVTFLHPKRLAVLTTSQRYSMLAYVLKTDASWPSRVHFGFRQLHRAVLRVREVLSGDGSRHCSGLHGCAKLQQDCAPPLAAHSTF